MNHPPVFSHISSSTFAGLVGHYSHPFSRLQNFLFTILSINQKPGILCALTSHLNYFAFEPFISNVALLAKFISMSVPFHALSSLPLLCKLFPHAPSLESPVTSVKPKPPLHDRFNTNTSTETPSPQSPIHNDLFSRCADEFSCSS